MCGAGRLPARCGLPLAAPAGTPREMLEKIAEGVREDSVTPQLEALRRSRPDLP